MLPAHPFPGVGGERSETEGGGRMGHSVARVLRVQRVVGIALRAMSFIARLAGTGLHWRPPPSTTSWSPSPRKRWEARLKGVVLSSMLPAHPLSGGGWRAQRDGRGRLYILHSFILSFMVLSISMQTSLK